MYLPAYVSRDYRRSSPGRPSIIHRGPKKTQTLVLPLQNTTDGFIRRFTHFSFSTLNLKLIFYHLTREGSNQLLDDDDEQPLNTIQGIIEGHYWQFVSQEEEVSHEDVKMARCQRTLLFKFKNLK